MHSCRLLSRKVLAKMPNKPALLTVSSNSFVHSQDDLFMITSAERGLGILGVPDFLAETPLQDGRLVQVMDTYKHKLHSI